MELYEYTVHELVDKLKKISDVYGIPYDELLKDTDYEYKKEQQLF